jgi:hypothetical protein
MAHDLIDSYFRTQERAIAPGVFGCVDSDGDTVVVMWLRAETEGSGDVGRWLDGLPTDRLVKVVAVTSDRLAGMLERRGFVQRMVLMPAADDWVPAHIRKAVRDG